MAEHMIKVTDLNYTEMLDKSVRMARSGLAVGFDLSALDAAKREGFRAQFNKASMEGTLMNGNRRSALIP